MKIIFFIFFVITMTGITMTSAYAQNNYDINIPTGAADPDAPYFWQSEKDGTTSGVVKILVGDTVTWKNADTAAHTVTSGTPTDGPDGIFDSGLFGIGKSFPQEFAESGNYPYFCVVHPWMIGEIIVTEGYSIIPNVGKDAGDGLTFFEVQYDFNRLLSTATVDENQNSITFEIVGVTKSDNHDLKILLPSELIDGPFVIFVDNKKLIDFTQSKSDDGNILSVPLDANSQTLTIIGTSVVPEFGTVAMMIMGMSTLGIIIASKRYRLQI